MSDSDPYYLDESMTQFPSGLESMWFEHSTSTTLTVGGGSGGIDIRSKPDVRLHAYKILYALLVLRPNIKWIRLIAKNETVCRNFYLRLGFTCSNKDDCVKRKVKIMHFLCSVTETFSWEYSRQIMVEKLRLKRNVIWKSIRSTLRRTLTSLICPYLQRKVRLLPVKE